MKRVSPILVALAVACGGLAACTKATTTTGSTTSTLQANISTGITVADGALSAYAAQHPGDPKVAIAQQIVTGIDAINTAVATGTTPETKIVSGLIAAIQQLQADDPSPIVQQTAPIAINALTALNASAAGGGTLKQQAIAAGTSVVVGYLANSL